MVEQVQRALPQLSRETEDASYAALVSVVWHQIGKFRWEIEESEAALGPFFKSLEAQRLACLLAPDNEEYRESLSWRLIQIGRKYCELGRFDDAARYFREQQALWPWDAKRRALGQPFQCHLLGRSAMIFAVETCSPLR
jgi:tetratricopeptide (TPR) repeat protein